MGTFLGDIWMQKKPGRGSPRGFIGLGSLRKWNCTALPVQYVRLLHPCHISAVLPIIEVPFERIAMDLVGPLLKSTRGHQHILVIMDYVIVIRRRLQR